MERVTNIRTGRRHGRDPNAPRRDRPSAAEREESLQRQRSTRETKAHEEWTQHIRGRKVTCERRVNHQSLENARVLHAIERRGMQFWYSDVPGYVFNWVVNFYSNMEYSIENQVMESTVNSVTILVTPDIIASLMGCTRPEARLVTYPRPPHADPINPNTVNQAVFEDGAHHTAGGMLRGDYRTLNKILHYNLKPRGKEKMPEPATLELLYAFMSAYETIDCAKWIFDEMISFRHERKHHTSLPFPHLVTRLCMNAGLRLTPGARMQKEKGDPGEINATTEKKSAANIGRRSVHETGQSSQAAGPSTQPPPTAPSSSRPPRRPSKLKILLAKLLCRNIEIQDDMWRLNHQQQYLIRQAQEPTREPYVPPEDRWGGREIGEHRSPPDGSDDDDGDGGGIQMGVDDFDSGMFGHYFS